MASAICATPAIPPGKIDCPADTGVEYTLTFSSTSRHYPLIYLGASGCADIKGVGATRSASFNLAIWSRLGTAMGVPDATSVTFSGA